MFRLRKEVKLFLVVFTILLSVYLGIQRSNLDKVFVRAEVKVDKERALEIFDQAMNNRKIKFDYNVEDLTDINTLLSSISELGESNILYSEMHNSFSLSLFEIAAENSDELLNELKNIDGITNQSIQQPASKNTNTDLKENLNNNKIAKKRIQNLINDSVSPDRITSFRKQLDAIQAKIDSLSVQEDIQKHNKEFDIVMITALKSRNGSSVLKRSISIFALTSLASLILIVVGLVISYYIFVVMYKLMLILGIRTSRGTSSNYNYNYNKSKHGKKVKRIYKDSEGNVVNKKTDKPDK